MSDYAIEAHELALYATNTGELYARFAQPIIANLAKKTAAGTYDAAKAPAAWSRYIMEAAKSYSRDFSSGDDVLTMFPKAARDLAVEEIMEHYADEIRDRAEEIRRDRENRRVWTLAAIRQETERRPDGSPFFSRETMRFFGDTMANFAVRCEGGEIYVERIRAGSRMGAGTNVGKRWRFDPETGRLV